MLTWPWYKKLYVQETLRAHVAMVQESSNQLKAWNLFEKVHCCIYNDVIASHTSTHMQRRETLTLQHALSFVRCVEHDHLRLSSPCTGFCWQSDGFIVLYSIPHDCTCCYGNSLKLQIFMVQPSCGYLQISAEIVCDKNFIVT